jgi:hypothetical protein
MLAEEDFASGEEVSGEDDEVAGGREWRVPLRVQICTWKREWV